VVGTKREQKRFVGVGEKSEKVKSKSTAQLDLLLAVSLWLVRGFAGLRVWAAGCVGLGGSATVRDRDDERAAVCRSGRLRLFQWVRIRCNKLALSDHPPVDVSEIL
jgi:hypothetical protein